MPFQSEVEQLVFEKIAPTFERDGYRFVSLSQANIPADWRGYRPDFIAQRDSDFVAIEVKTRRTPSIERSLEALKQDIERNASWTFRVFYVDEEIKSSALPTPNEGQIDAASIEIRAASNHGFKKAAFLLSWALFEAAARKLHGKIFLKPQSPGRIITVLAERGIITPDQADKARSLSVKRNSLVHGHLGISVDSDEVDFMHTLALHIAPSSRIN